MMSASDFKTKSSVRFARRKNPIILDIDKLLNEYEKSVSENRKMKCLVYIYMMCKHYLHTKPDGGRGDAVKLLMGDVREVLDSKSFGQQIAQKAGGRHYDNGIQRNAMDSGSNTATSLQQGYTWEGILPQKNFVEKMGLHMESLLGPDKYFGSSGIGASIADDLSQKGGGANIDKQAQHMLKTMTISQVLDKLHAMWVDEACKGEFNYLNAAARMDYLVVVKGGLLYQHSGSKLDTGNNYGIPAPRLYAMDTSERVYSLRDGVHGKEGTDWNHSSMLSGHPVICAGMLIVTNGVLKSIDNNSGHYKPDAQNLVDCVKSLGRAGVPLNSFAVMEKGSGVKFTTAAQFLAAHP